MNITPHAIECWCHLCAGEKMPKQDTDYPEPNMIDLDNLENIVGKLKYSAPETKAAPACRCDVDGSIAEDKGVHLPGCPAGAAEYVTVRGIPAPSGGMREARTTVLLPVEPRPNEAELGFCATCGFNRFRAQEDRDELADMIERDGRYISILGHERDAALKRAAALKREIEGLRSQAEIFQVQVAEYAKERMQLQADADEQEGVLKLGCEALNKIAARVDKDSILYQIAMDALGVTNGA